MVDQCGNYLEVQSTVDVHPILVAHVGAAGGVGFHSTELYYWAGGVVSPVFLNSERRKFRQELRLSGGDLLNFTEARPSFFNIRA